MSIDLAALISEPSWRAQLADVWTEQEAIALSAFLSKELDQGQILLPPQADWFRALNLTPFAKVKVVIVGQDPYPTPGHAHGLSFSVAAQVNPLPKSLKNIFQELIDDIGHCPMNGDLANWADQGVLLLNRVLSLRAHQTHSHQRRGWEAITAKIITCLNQHPNNLIFILWGKPAQQLQRHLDPRHHCIMSAHPSPLSAYRGFWGSKPFSRTNQFLEDQGLSPIDWR